MTSRRNFVISTGTLLTGSGAFLGSGAFGVGNARNPENWIPVGVRTPPSEGLESSAGLQQEGGGADRTDGGSEGDGGQSSGDGTGADGTGEDDSDADGDGDDDGDDGTDEDRDENEGGSEGGGSSGETSVRLEATGSEVLSSEHVLASDDGTLQGLQLENLNMNALTYVGETSDGRFPNPGAGDRVAFLAINDGDVAVDLRVDVDGTAPEVLNFPAWVDAAVSGPRQRDLTGVPISGLPPGGVVHVVIEVDTTATDPVPDDAVEGVTFVADPV